MCVNKRTARLARMLVTASDIGKDFFMLRPPIEQARARLQSYPESRPSREGGS
jgi:hypothetical protein